MAQFIQMKLGEGTALIEVADHYSKSTADDYAEHRGKEKIFGRLDQHLEQAIQQQIFGYCNALTETFTQLKKQNLSLKKAHIEFGLQFNTEGNIYLAKIGGQSSFRISMEWEL